MPADSLLDIDLAYGRRGLRISLPADRTTVVAPAHHPAAPDVPAALHGALREPVAGPPLRALVRPGQSVAVSVCDVTRPQPREAMLRALLAELEGLVTPEDVTVLIATGTHRGNTPAEPTGAALLRAAGCRYGPVPAMRVAGSGYGAGARDVPGRPNVLAALLGEPAGDEELAGTGETLVMVETTVDDVTGELLGDLPGLLLSAGALDAWITAVTGKKGRRTSSPRCAGPGTTGRSWPGCSPRPAAWVRGAITSGARRCPGGRPRRPCRVTASGSRSARTGPSPSTTTWPPRPWPPACPAASWPSRRSASWARSCPGLRRSGRPGRPAPAGCRPRRRPARAW